MKKTLFTLLLFICIGSSSMYSQEIPDDYKKAVKEMFILSGTEQVYDIMIDGLFEMYKKQHTDVPSDLWDGLKKEFKGESINELTDLLIPTYFKHFTIEDIKTLNAFYTSTAGKKLIEKTPLIMQDAMIIGEQWGKGIGEKFVLKLQEKGY